MSVLIIFLGTAIILSIINLPQWINIIILMCIIFWQFVKITKKTSENTNFKGDSYYNGRNKWTQEQWDNWNPCSKKNVDELYKNEFKLDKNGNWRYKGDHL